MYYAYRYGCGQRNNTARKQTQYQGRSDGGYIGIYTPKISLLYKFYVVTGCFFLFDSGQIRYRASVRLSKISKVKIYTPSK